MASSDVIRCIDERLGWHTLYGTSQDGKFPIKKLINRSKVEPTIFALVKKEGKAVQQVLKEQGIPEYAHRYYGADGNFKYRPDHPIQLSSENGDDELALARIQFATFEKLEHQRVYDLLVKDYLHVLEELPHAELRIVTDEKSKPALVSLLRGASESVRKRVKTVTIESEHPLELWAQDGSKPIKDPEHYRIQTLVPYEHEDGAKSEIWQELEGKGWPTQRSIFHFEGGDVVVGARHVFVGPTVIEDNMKKFRISRSEALQALSAEFGKPVFEIKRNKIPKKADPSFTHPIDFHIDMFLSVARNHKTGKETVLLSSPELGFKALAGRRKDADFPEDWDIMAEHLVQGAKDDANGFLTDAERELIATIKKTSPYAFRVQQDQVNAEAVRLKALGYDIKFVPGLAQMHGEREMGQWEIFGYANSILSGKKAIIPELGIPRLDRAATQAFEDLGYKVIHVYSPTESLCLKGGIRCMTETYRVHESFDSK